MRLHTAALSLALLWPALAAAEARPSLGDTPRGVAPRPQLTEQQPAVRLALDTRPGGGGPTGPSTTPPPSTRDPGRDDPARSNPARNDPSRDRPTPTPATDDGDAPMRFQLVREGPADRCDKSCRTWLVASGRITLETARDFETFARDRERELRGGLVVLESNGGAVDGGIALGRAFRRLDMTVTVGKTTMLPASNGETRATFSPRGTCASMCAFALLGGGRRYVPPEARVLVHQIWPSAKREDAAAQTYTAENLTALQRSLGILAHYTIEMGGDIELFELAMRIPPWERMRALSAEDLQRLHLRTVDNPFTGPTAAATPVTPAPPIATKPEPPAVGGWMMTEHDGLRGLARRHPLTIEGDEIGSFEIMVACGDGPDAYALRYTETRRPPEGTDRLNKVVIASGKDRLTLTVESSAKTDANLRSTARGTMPSALLRGLADVGQHSMVVATETSNNVRTLIQVGNTGLDAAFPQLARTCKQ